MSSFEKIKRKRSNNKGKRNRKKSRRDHYASRDGVVYDYDKDGRLVLHREPRAA